MTYADQVRLLKAARDVVNSYETGLPDRNTMDELAGRLLRVGLAIIELKQTLKEIEGEHYGIPANSDRP